jgi:hypothetical protein
MSNKQNRKKKDGQPSCAVATGSAQSFNSRITFFGCLILEEPTGQWAVVETHAFRTREEAQSFGEAKLLLTHESVKPSRLVWRIKSHVAL